MYNILHVLTGIGLLCPLIYLYLQGSTNWPLFLVLFLQGLIGNIALLYVRAYEDKRNWSLHYTAYFLFFTGLSAIYFTGKTNWIWFFWELSASACFLFYIGKEKILKRDILSILSLSLVSAVSMFLLATWVFLKEDDKAIYFLISALFLKSAFSGFHLWLSKADSGGPSHSLAIFSSLYLNMPPILFLLYIGPVWEQVKLGFILIPLAGLGVFFGGITAFFHKDIKKSLAYSSIENINLIWFSLFMFLELKSSSIENLRFLSDGFYVLFLLSILNHSLSKSFQFFSFGYLTKVFHVEDIDSAKGIGRLSQIPSWLLGVGTFSFLGLPGTPGFLFAASLLYMFSFIIDLSIPDSIFILSGIIPVIFGIILGDFSHLRLYLSTTFSLPDKKHFDKVVLDKPILLKKSLILHASGMIILGIVMNVLLIYFTDKNFQNWFLSLLFVSILTIIFISFLLFIKRKSIVRKLSWDCGNNYSSSVTNIPASVISDPIHSFIGKYFISSEGESIIDTFLERNLLFLMNIRKLKAGIEQSGEVSNYLAFSSFVFILSILILGILLF
ncbi:MAG: hypothetical protein H7A25_09325 [Leptospiraceae bacterium]|nr:hypothetical protein [Leptospiraceae bacterium]MCP5500090.1 hypothetical protein [Leptospiraceae bacterium]